jgi:uncharacterized protein
MPGAMPTRREFLEVNAKALTAAALAAGCAASRAPVLNETFHRPWPLPQTSWLLSMRWHDLLFLHWPIRPHVIRRLIPGALELETFDGWCWIGVVPFRMSGVRPRYVPIPLAFPELNVRTYVRTPGRSGVWFFSLDAANWLVVRGARWLGLPYYDASMAVEPKGEAVQYESMRGHDKAAPAEFIGSYKPTGPIYHAVPGTLDHWLTERYCLYGALKPERIVYGEIHHPPWPLQPAEVELRANTMIQALGIELPDNKPICHFARYQEVVAWPIVPIERMK